MEDKQLRSKIRTFAILDLEINGNYQYQFNKCSIIELCIYGISAEFLKNDIIRNGREADVAPALPRVLNRINLMVNPRNLIHPYTKTGLDNDMLEHETHFDVETAECIMKFLSRLEKPVCLVAHNGHNHDFPIIRHAYDKIQMEFFPNIYCIDSVDAFRVIDKQLYAWAKINADIIARQSTTQLSIQDDEESQESQFEDIQINWQVINENTPTTTSHRGSTARRPLGLTTRGIRRGANISRVRRRLQFDAQPKTFMSYKLSDLHKSIFKESAVKKLHHAETDVKLLAELVVHYGLEFVKYAEERKRTFNTISMLGIKTSY